MKTNIFSFLAWIGTGLVLSSYFLVSFEYIESSNLLYSLMNLFGAFFLGIELFFKKASAALALQIVWGIIAFATLVKIFLN